MKDETGQFACTVVSILPFPITETKPGLIVGYYAMPAAKKDDFEILVVYPTHFPLYVDQTRGSVPIPVPSDQLAQSVVDDFINSQMGIKRDAEEPAYPGLFFVLGKRDKEYIKKEHADALLEARTAQKNWFLRLVHLADDDWQRYRQHKTISDLQRFAARDLGLDRPWLLLVADKPQAPGVKTCPACQMSVHEMAAICPSCRCVLNEKLYKSFQFASVGATNVPSVSKSNP